MIYITIGNTGDYNHIANVWQVDVDNVEELYKQFILDKSIEMNIIIHPYRLNMMNYNDHNSHLTKTEYNNLSKKWKKFQHLWNKDKFISDELNGIKLEFKSLNN